MRKILFNNILRSDNYLRHFEYLFSDYDLFRKKHFSGLCLGHLQPLFPGSSLFLTHSATGALEMIAHLLDIGEGDEVIMPSFTFVSTANAFASHGATPVFADIDPVTLNLDVAQAEQAITPRTKAIVAVHYAGFPCDLKGLRALCDRHGLYLIEDAAMGYGNQYEDKWLGACGDFGVVSFDITKQISAVQGGLLLVNNPAFAERANNIYHIGTDRTAFQQGQKPYYEWVDVGSKFQMNELSAVVLHEYLENASLFDTLNGLAEMYRDRLSALAGKGRFALMRQAEPGQCIQQFHLFTADGPERTKLAAFLAASGIEALFHYIPLHDSAFGRKAGRSGKQEHTEYIAERLLRLPLHAALDEQDIEYVCDRIKAFYENE